MFIHVHAVLFAVFALVSGQSLCPYDRPQDEVMTCIQNMPRIDTGARPDRYSPPPDGDRQARQAVEETEVEKPPSTVPVGPPPISGEIVDYLCSSASDELVNCTTKVYELCEGHPGLMSMAYNPAVTESVKMKCSSQHQEFKDSLECMKTSSKSKQIQDCFEQIAKDIQEKDIPPQLISCSIPAGLYNCMVTHIGSDCGKSTVAFYISTLRMMEDPTCTKVINQQYKEPVSAGTQTMTSLVLIIVSLMCIFM